jgi:hypothetical protein
VLKERRATEEKLVLEVFGAFGARRGGLEARDLVVLPVRQVLVGGTSRATTRTTTSRGTLQSRSQAVEDQRATLAFLEALVRQVRPDPLA